MPGHKPANRHALRCARAVECHLRFPKGRCPPSASGLNHRTLPALPLVKASLGQSVVRVRRRCRSWAALEFRPRWMRQSTRTGSRRGCLDHTRDSGARLARQIVADEEARHLRPYYRDASTDPRSAHTSKHSCASSTRFNAQRLRKSHGSCRFAAPPMRRDTVRHFSGTYRYTRVRHDGELKISCSESTCSAVPYDYMLRVWV